MALTGVDVTGRRLVVFDFDGTLADTVPGIVATARRVLLEHGLAEEDLGDLTRLVGPPFPQAFSLVYGLPAAEAEQVTARYREIYATLGTAGWPLFDGIEELLGDLRAAGWLVAVASSKRQDVLDRATGSLGVAGLFDACLGKRSDAEGTKVDVIGRVLAELGAGADEAVMVGDRDLDVEAAAAWKIPCVGVTYAHTAAPGELERAGACAKASSVAELRRVLLG